MRTVLLTLALVTLFLPAFGDTGLPEFYHTPEEIKAQLFAWQEQYPNLIKVDSIGVVDVPYSHEQNPGMENFADHYAIWAAKLSDNVSVDEDEANLMFTCMHAEELIGLEMNMYLILRLLNTPRLLSNVQIWVIPTYNPGGLKVVHELDNSYRKNLRDNNNDGIFEYSTQVGYDRDGVDLNRNWSWGWVHGDTLYAQTGVNERFDYYRGPGPNSEPETQTIINFANQHNILYGVTFHSSRSGNYSNKLYYPYQFYGFAERSAPDLTISKEMGDTMAGMMTALGGGNYMSLPAEGYVGKSTSWFYREYNSFHLTIELSSNQPDNITTMYQICEGAWPGIEYMIQRGAGVADNNRLLTGHITDAVSGQPLEAEVIVHELQSDSFRPRLSNATYGRYWRPTNYGSYTISYIKDGYQTVTDQVVVNPSSVTNHDVQLTPLAPVTINGSLTLAGQPTSGWVSFERVNNDTLQTSNGTFSYNGYQGTYMVKAWAPGGYVYIDEIEVENGSYNLDIDLSAAQVAFADDFESGTSNWNITGPWQIESQLAHNGSAITDSWGGKGFYAMNADVNITTAQQIDLTGVQNPMLTFWQHLHTEWDHDFVYVEVSPDGQDWEQIWSDCGDKYRWHPVYIPLNLDYNQVYLRFRLVDESPDERLTDPGWTIDDLAVIGGQASIDLVDSNDLTVPVAPAVLSQNYPNPFNPQTTIAFSLPTAARNPQLRIYNLRGQLQQKVNLSQEQVTSGKFVWTANKASSGVYFYSLWANGKCQAVNKAILLK